MSALMIISYDVLDNDMLKEYKRQAGPIISAGAELIAMSKETVDLGEGGSPGKITAILKFPTVEAAKAAYEDEAYQEYLPLRMQSTRPAFAIIAEAFDK